MYGSAAAGLDVAADAADSSRDGRREVVAAQDRVPGCAGQALREDVRGCAASAGHVARGRRTHAQRPGARIDRRVNLSYSAVPGSRPISGRGVEGRVVAGQEVIRRPLDVDGGYSFAAHADVEREVGLLGGPQCELGPGPPRAAQGDELR